MSRILPVMPTQNAATLFQKIHCVLQRIPPGKVATYGQIAALAGNPRAARTVGWVLHALSDDAVPWHRVINAHGRSSFAEEAKRRLQQALLEDEGVAFDASGQVNFEVFRWDGK